ncbi:metallophosphoesterase [Achromobacter sp. NPDC058515]|uniref:metallophosphoesterase n=1 Tax=Achromobacter sp. NPDC058515 TaxID=3346533 RepID=UPI00366354B4
MEMKGRRLFRFAVVADSHLNPVGADNTSPWQTNHLANPRNEVVVEAINAIAPVFTVHVGDVVHPLPHTADYEPAAHFAQSLYQRLDAPFYIAPGNHDIGDKCLPGNPAATISEATCAKYEEKFGAQWQRFDHAGICFVIVNACLFGSGLPQEEAQWAFLDEVVASTADKRVFLFSHYPPFITAADEEDNYDNIDGAPRRRLIELLERSNVEALFAGHVHTFFLNKIGKAWSYALPSSTNFRQDYAELFRVAPAEELGRNDLGKFGFFVVDVHEHGHIARFVRTYGSTDAGEVGDMVVQLGEDIRGHDAPTVGVEFNHDWAGAQLLPCNPPLDAFIRKRVRNDYFALNLWDAGVRTARVPLADVADDVAFERMALMAGLGHRFTVHGAVPPGPQALDRLASIAPSLAGYEMIAPEDALDEALAARLKAVGVPVFFAPILRPSTDKHATFDHTMSCGLPVGDLARLDAFKRLIRSGAGLLIRIGPDDPVLESLQAIAEQAGAQDLRVSVHVVLAAGKSSHVQDNDARQAARSTEAALAALLYPHIPVTLDTFMDVDRGYFSRNGLVDRRHNPRRAAVMLRKLHDRLARAGELRLLSFSRADDGLALLLQPGAEGKPFQCRIPLPVQAAAAGAATLADWRDIALFS